MLWRLLLNKQCRLNQANIPLPFWTEVNKVRVVHTEIERRVSINVGLDILYS